MFFDLTNVPANFQEYINKIFVWKLDIFVIMYLDNILIYIKDDRNSQVVVIWWILEQLKKFLLYAKWKKCQFHQEEIWFFSYMMFSKGIRMEGKRIEIVK